MIELREKREYLKESMTSKKNVKIFQNKMMSFLYVSEMFNKN